jgi:hypothetical protein
MSLLGAGQRGQRGQDNEDSLAWVLFAEIDGGVHLLEGHGLELFMGLATEELLYPIRIDDLKELARQMEAAEDARLSRERDAGDEAKQTATDGDFVSLRHGLHCLLAASTAGTHHTRCYLPSASDPVR